MRPHHEHANSPHLLRLLRARRERPCDRRAAEKRDELAALQLIEVRPALFRMVHTASWPVHPPLPSVLPSALRRQNDTE
jgi:hypothetical protein